MSGLFRNEVLEARQHAWLGEVLVRPPLSATVCAVVAGALTAAIVALVVFGPYTKRARVLGITVPAAGVLKLTTPQPGVVVERHIEEGDEVRQGQVLFVLSSDRIASVPGWSAGASPDAGTQATILEHLVQRRASLEEEATRRARLLEEQAVAASRRHAALRMEAMQLQKELETQSSRETSAAEQAARYEELARQGFISALTARQRRDDLLDQTARRQALERTLLGLQRELQASEAELRQLPLRAEQQQAEVQRERSALAQDIVATEAARAVVVTAPQDGTVTAIAAERGQTVTGQALATLLPRGSPLEAHLFAPGRAVGFIRPGQAVRVRFAAYPYQKFGQYAGEVSHVSRAALAPSELPPQLGAPPGNEPLYRITVRLASPAVMAYGTPQPLTAGMPLEADVMQDRRRLIEWVFEPLIALGRKF